MKYKVVLTRKVLQDVDVIVEANNETEASDKALGADIPESSWRDWDVETEVANEGDKVELYKGEQLCAGTILIS